MKNIESDNVIVISMSHSYLEQDETIELGRYHNLFHPQA